MMRLRTAALAASIVAGAGAAVVLHSQEPQAPGSKLTNEQIFEFHTRQDQPGTAEAGRAVYEKQCAACHRFGAVGKELGPDLSTITSRFTKKDLLEAILWPSKVISDQYKSELFELKNGKVISGVVVRETAASVLVRTAELPERPVSVPKAQIAERGESKVSLMPEGLLEGYSHADIANLLAFLMSAPPTAARGGAVPSVQRRVEEMKATGEVPNPSDLRVFCFPPSMAALLRAARLLAAARQANVPQLILYPNPPLRTGADEAADALVAAVAPGARLVTPATLAATAGATP